MPLVFKAIVWFLLACIFFALGSALYYLVSENHDSEKMIKALSWRIGLSMFLFILLFIAYALGWIKPHSLI